MRLKQLRKARNLYQRDVADVINCSQAVYSRYESGERTPSPDILQTLSQFYGVSVDYILGSEPADSLHHMHSDLFPADSGGIKHGYQYTPPESVSPDPLSPLKQEILSKLDGLSEDKLSNALSYIDFLKSNK